MLVACAVSFVNEIVRTVVAADGFLVVVVLWCFEVLLSVSVVDAWSSSSSSCSSPLRFRNLSSSVRATASQPSSATVDWISGTAEDVVAARDAGGVMLARRTSGRANTAEVRQARIRSKAYATCTRGGWELDPQALERRDGRDWRPVGNEASMLELEEIKRKEKKRVTSLATKLKKERISGLRDEVLKSRVGHELPGLMFQLDGAKLRAC